MATFIPRTFAPLLIFLLLLVRWSYAKKITDLTACSNAPESDCWHKDWIVRDKICASKGWYCRYSYDFLTTNDTLGRCFCCGKGSYYQFPDFSKCVLLNGLVTDISILRHIRDPELTNKTLEISYSQKNESLNDYVTLKGEDVKQVIYHEYLWKTRLQSCQVTNGITLKKLWENTWTDEMTFRDTFFAKICNRSDPEYHSSQKRIILSNSTFVLKRNIPNLAVNESITAYRYYVIDRFYLSLLLNITGVYLHFDGKFGAKELKESLDQTGLTYKRELDNFTVLAETTVLIESKFPVSTVYKLVVTSKDVSTKSKNSLSMDNSIK